MADAQKKQGGLCVSTNAKARYREYLNSSEWEFLRNAAYTKAKGLCELCGQTAGGVHHIRYPKNLKEDDSLDNLVVVCATCHSRLHGITGLDDNSTFDITGFATELKRMHITLNTYNRVLMDRWERLEERTSKLKEKIDSLGYSDEVLNEEYRLLLEEQNFILNLTMYKC